MKNQCFVPVRRLMVLLGVVATLLGVVVSCTNQVSVNGATAKLPAAASASATPTTVPTATTVPSPTTVPIAAGVIVDEGDDSQVIRVCDENDPVTLFDGELSVDYYIYVRAFYEDGGHSYAWEVELTTASDRHILVFDETRRRVGQDQWIERWTPYSVEMIEAWAGAGSNDCFELRVRR